MDIEIEPELEYPVIFIPKNCTNLYTECEATDNVFIDLNITSLDAEGNEMVIYNGFCNVKLVEGYNVNVQEVDAQAQESTSPIVVTEANQAPYDQSQVWIDPARSPYVYNSYEECEERYSVYNSTSHITVEQHNTYVTQNVYSYSETECTQFEHKKFKVQTTELNQTVDQLYTDDEYECGVLLSQISEDIGKEKRTDNGALQQLMSSDIQSQSKLQKTILYLGNNSQCGQTIQNIAINDPFLQCDDHVLEAGVEIVSENHPTNKKKYQCDKCKQIFYHLSTFKQHVVSHRRKLPVLVDERLVCGECGRSFCSREKLDLHRLRHGDPDLECDRCKKVFASKFTLRTHLKIHSRKYCCKFCAKSYTNAEQLTAHLAKIHFVFTCDSCEFTTGSYLDLDRHKDTHKINSDTESAVSLLSSDSTVAVSDEEQNVHDQIRQANSVIAQVINNEFFLLHAKKTRRHRKYNKKCAVCHKTFDRVGDLKRHLIEHIIRSTLAKTPVNINGTLTIECEVCQRVTFKKIDKYKEHLREHAKLTIYKCTFCDKSFSDSSNFSKHKKIHGTTFFQCDLCQRKFNTKNMIVQHMEYHKNNSPLSCLYCDKEFHFQSMLNKHIKCAHTREVSTFRCRFCHQYFRRLKEKWDHEWKIHKVRKFVVDCVICGAKFRKYSELKRHCVYIHKIEIPLAKRLIKEWPMMAPSRLVK